MTMFSHTETLAALRALLVTASGLPDASHRAWENDDFSAPVDEVYIKDEFVPAAATLHTITANGVLERNGLYIVTWVGLANTGDDDVLAGADAILAVFPPGLGSPMMSGLTLRIRGDVAPFAGQVINDANARACCQITVPWRVYSLNAVSA